MVSRHYIAERYRVLKELGRGGMAVVYQALDEALERIVAIKVLHPHLASEEGNRRRFRREAQSIARLRDPHIVEVYDFCTESKERSFIVMEYVEGVNLRQWIREHGSPEPEIALLMALSISRALEHAHALGIVHRDIKPENVMVSADQASIKLMDFGIAQVVDADTLTATGSLLGSPAHMAPEIIDAEPADHRTDIFSLGTVLYWLISGELPFRGQSTTQLLKAILMGEFIPLIQAAPKAGRQISELTTRCILRDPEARYPDIHAVIEAIKSCLETSLIDPVQYDTILMSYFQDPERFAKDFQPYLLETLKMQVRFYRQQKKYPQAIHLLNRLAAYCPNDETVAYELKILTRMDHMPSLGVWVLGVMLVLSFSLGGYFLWQQWLTEVDPESDSGGDSPLATLQQGPPKPLPKVLPQTLDLGVAQADAAAQASTMATLVFQNLDKVVQNALIDDLPKSEAPSPEPKIEPKARPKKLPKTQAQDTPVEKKDVSETLKGLQPDSVAKNKTEVETLDADNLSGPGGPKAVQTYDYKFRLLPTAASLKINDKVYSFSEAMAGVQLAPGIHQVEVTSSGCKPLKTRIRVNGPQKGDPISFVLEWKEGTIQVFANEPGVLWVGDSNHPRRFDRNGENATVSIPFGDARSWVTKRQLKLTLAPLDRLQQRVTRQISVRPGEKTLVNIAFSE